MSGLLIATRRFLLRAIEVALKINLLLSADNVVVERYQYALPESPFFSLLLESVKY